MISVLILTYQEELNIARCIAALDWCDDVLVVDSFSTDRTVEIAEACGARVLQHRFDNFAAQRNFGIAHGGMRHEWVLHLDADEIVTRKMRDEMMRRLPTATEDAFRVASKLLLDGAWLKHSGMYPTYQVRVGRRDRLTFAIVGHGQRETLPPERLGTLDSPLLHNAFSKGMADWLARHNTYSTAEARHIVEGGFDPAAESLSLPLLLDPMRRRRLLKRAFANAPLRPLLRFLYMYVGRAGFLDGRAGFTYCCLLAIYEYMISLKIRELRRQNFPEPPGVSSVPDGTRDPQ